MNGGDLSQSGGTVLTHSRRSQPPLAPSQAFTGPTEAIEQYVPLCTAINSSRIVRPAIS